MTSRKTRTVAVASGKGGAGKTTAAACLAWVLAEQGRTVCLVDVDLGLSNVDVLLGISPQWTLEDVILGDTPVEQAITKVRSGLDVISGGSGAAALANLGRKHQAAFLAKINSLNHYDFLILDNSPGIHRQVIAFCLAARELIIVLNPEPSSVTDAYALLKVLMQNGLHRLPYVLLNKVPQGFAHTVLLERFAAVCKKYLQTSILSLGAVPTDPFFREAANRSTLPAALHPQSPGVVALIRAAALLCKRAKHKALYSNVEEFWNASLINMFQGVSLSGPDRDAGKTETVNDLIGRLEGILLALENKVSDASAEEEADAAHRDAVAARRLYAAGERLTRMAAKRLRGTKPVAAGPEIGVFCPDPSLRMLLVELVENKVGRARTINGLSDRPEGLDLVLCSVNRPDILMLQALQSLHATPCIWLSEYKREVPEWARGLEVVEIVEKPFSLEKIYRALDKALPLAQRQ